MNKKSNEQIAELEAEIRKHQRLYYDMHEPVISDSEYDKLFEKLQELDPDSPVLNERSQFDADYKHEFPMGSLDKCKTVEEIYKRIGGKGLGTISAKLDGASLAIHYNNGRLVRAVTRGRTDTGKGKIVTANALAIPSIPKTIPYHNEIEIRGECLIMLSDFTKIAHLYSNPRNAASGGISCQDPQQCADRLITFFACKCIENGVDIQLFPQLEAWGFKVPHYVTVNLCSEEDINEAIEDWKTIRNELPYQTDGIVIRINDVSIYNDMGFSGVCPKGACAFKFEAETAESIIRDIEWETGRLGYVTPVAVFDTVPLGGAMVSRCTLNNPTWMKSHGNPSIGSKITIAKHNDIIPGIVGVDGGTGYTKQPTNCPSCGSKLEDDGAKLICNQVSCPAKFQGTILNSLRKFEIKGMSDKTLEKIIEAGLVRNPWEIFDLCIEDLVENAGLGNRESKNIIDSLKDIDASPSHILAAIGLDLWGRRMFELLQNNSVIYTDDKLLAGDFKYDELMTVLGVGPEKARVLADAFVENGYGKIFLTELLKRVKAIKKKVVVGGTVNGKSFCLSGSMPRGKKQIEEDIINAGGTVSSSVSKKLNYLVAGEGSGSKSEKATELGISIITEDELYKMLGLS